MSDKAGIPASDCQYINFVYVIFSKIARLPFFCHRAYILLQSASECCNIKGVLGVLTVPQGKQECKKCP